MRRFAELYEEIDRTTSTNAKVAAMATYFRSAPAIEAAWAVYFLTGRKLKRVLSGPALGRWVEELAGLPHWLLGECLSAVGDFAETATLVLDGVASGAADGPELGLDVWVQERAEPLRGMEPYEQRQVVMEALLTLPRTQRFLFIKLLTGELRVGVSQVLVERALAVAGGLEVKTVAQRLVGEWRPSAAWYARILSRDEHEADVMRPYPFYLASPLLAQDGGAAGVAEVEGLGAVSEWLLEWKWDGIRAQLIRRGGKVALWSRGDEVLTARFPEMVEGATRIADGTVLDGEVVSWHEGRVQPFAMLQRRIGRQHLTRQLLAKYPAAFVAYDLLERDGRDMRAEPLSVRRALLEEVVRGAGSARIMASDVVMAPSWEAAAQLREESRARGVEGLMIKRRESAYGVGRVKGDWWKWKIEPYSVDCVLVYAEPGHGRRASLLTDYTFAVWDDDGTGGRALVPFAKAYSGLSNEEIAELDKWIRQHTLARHGPVRVVEPVQVFELGFEGIARSMRHRSGVAVRFPRMLRWRKDKPVAEADTMASLRELVGEEPREETLFG